jgi:polyribonucleotide 5'-hydroxyl-kinase
VNILICLGSERLYSDLNRKYANRDPSEAVHVIRIDKSGGCVDRSEEYMKSLRHAQIREYFFGHGENTLAPSSQSCDFGDLNVFQLTEGELIPKALGVERRKSANSLLRTHRRRSLPF